MKRNIKSKNIALVLTACTCVTMSSTALASEIELSSEDTSETHDCVYSEHYDSKEHWGVCDICGAISEKIEHNLDKLYTYGENTCHESSTVISECKDCGFSEIAEYHHEVQHIPYEIGVNEDTIWALCNNCGEFYQEFSSDGMFTYEDGTMVQSMDELMVKLPCVLKDKYGNGIYVDKVFDEMEYPESLIENNITFDESNENVTISAVCQVPMEALSYVSGDLSKINFSLLAYGVVDGTQMDAVSVIEPDTVIKENGKITFSATLPLRSIYKTIDKPAENDKHLNLYGSIEMMIDYVTATSMKEGEEGNTSKRYGVKRYISNPIHIASEPGEPEIGTVAVDDK